MFFYLQAINVAYALGGLTLLLVTLLLAYDYFFSDSRWYRRLLARYVWWILLIATWGGVATSLLYSEYFGFLPCSLCWLQRIALYPQALLGVVAYRVRDSVHFPIYGIVLSIFGFAVAVYQYVYQMIPSETIAAGVVPCLADGTADCGEKVIEVFGFVTFPFLSAVTFAFLIVLYLNIRRSTAAL
ncbi:disulfide bond formation protein B [Candidatus Parcubacteria bacterium]|nr:disulfide bond formation protein B [Candidatus Parcubacteria bacterium]